MTHEISLPRMSHLSLFEGTIGIEDIGEGENVEIVVRIPMDQETASDQYYMLGNME